MCFFPVPGHPRACVPRRPLRSRVPPCSMLRTSDQSSGHLCLCAFVHPVRPPARRQSGSCTHFQVLRWYAPPPPPPGLGRPFPFPTGRSHRVRRPPARGRPFPGSSLRSRLWTSHRMLWRPGRLAWALPKAGPSAQDGLAAAGRACPGFPSACRLASLCHVHRVCRCTRPANRQSWRGARSRPRRREQTRRRSKPPHRCALHHVGETRTLFCVFHRRWATGV